MALTEIAKRIVSLSELYKTDKEFIETCGITNGAFLTNLKSEKNKNPGADYARLIVEGTGCSAHWLLTGEGKMFDKIDYSNEIDGKANNFEVLKLLTVLQEKEDELKLLMESDKHRETIDQFLISILKKRLNS